MVEKLKDKQKRFYHKNFDEEFKSDKIRINGHWIQNDKYTRDPEKYNKLLFTENYIKECGLTPERIRPDMLPESLQVAS